MILTLSVRLSRSLIAILTAVAVQLAPSALVAQGATDCITWGTAPPPPPLPIGQSYIDVSAGLSHFVALRSNGTAVGWGENSYGECELPPFSPLAYGMRYVQVAGGFGFTLARRYNGTAVAVGRNTFGECNVPALPSGVTFRRVIAGTFHGGGLLSNGGLAIWGTGGGNLSSVPPLPAGKTYEDAALGILHAVALRSDGVVLAWGDNQYGQCNVPPLPPGIRYVQVVAGHYFSAARRSDGFVTVWGGLSPELRIVPSVPSRVSYVELAACSISLMARRSDGGLVQWGTQATPPALPPGLTAVQITGGSSGFAARFGSASTFVAFGNGCSGSRAVCRLTPSDTPKIGATFAVELDQLPVDAALMIVGYSNSMSQFGPLPIDLRALQAPGCWARVSDDAITFVLGAQGRATYRHTVPNSASFVGFRFHLQALVLDPAANGLGAVFSDAVTATIGYR